jgi:hypothetical protein
VLTGFSDGAGRRAMGSAELLETSGAVSEAAVQRIGEAADWFETALSASVSSTSTLTATAAPAAASSITSSFSSGPTAPATADLAPAMAVGAAVSERGFQDAGGAGAGAGYEDPVMRFARSQEKATRGEGAGAGAGAGDSAPPGMKARAEGPGATTTAATTATTAAADAATGVNDTELYEELALRCQAALLREGRLHISSVGPVVR